MFNRNYLGILIGLVYITFVIIIVDMLIRGLYGIYP